MTYKQIITQCCEDYAKDPLTRFVGYNTLKGSRMYGTLSSVPDSQCIETPVAENLMVGLAMGMSVEGFKPVVCFERHDFMLLALDAMVNHVDKLPKMSDYSIDFPIIIRAIIGAKKPLDAGVQHTQNYYNAFKCMFKDTPVLFPKSIREMRQAWTLWPNMSDSGAVIIVEDRGLYEEEIKDAPED